MPKFIVKNSNGEVVKLNTMEQRIANLNQKYCNALGYEVNITTLTEISKEVTEQKFFEIPPADYLPVRVGTGAWSTNILTYRSFMLGDDFATGVINTGTGDARLATTTAGVDTLSVAVKNWAKRIGYTLFDLQHASRAGNWDLVSEMEQSRKKNWDLGIQKVAFLGLTGNSSVLGLYNQSGVTNNTSVITGAIKSMTATNYKAFLAGLIAAYRLNTVNTAWPTHFIIPESDYVGLAAPTNSDFPLKSMLEVITDALKVMTRNPNFKVLPNAYGDSANNGLGVQRYILLNYDPKSLRMDIPVDYNATLANSIDNFSFQNTGYGQFTGVLAYRPLEIMYFSY